MPDRCEVLPGDAVVARRGGGLLWVDAPGSPALVAALHACLGVSGPGADRVLSAVAGQVSSLAHGTASFALVLTDTAGLSWIERDTVTRAFRTIVGRDAPAESAEGTLTPREVEMVRMVAQGLRNKAIAERLAISEGTVKVHLHNIYEKFGVDGRLELLLYAQQKGWL